ncbi:hypothetical protein FXV83_02450 [Bradyrhizobium hipponense]|uniref:Uncharacterized protein n=1 Tax=Bradyrhizobium hipponense TaxID=2605638 RepID=A0A5S4YVN7_9BRAD|nr:hypothetical protein FXV83_02450 [Bradyrhizobium hipponense]
MESRPSSWSVRRTRWNSRRSLHSSLRAKRSNPDCFRGGILDCFVARAPRNDGARMLHAC